MIMLTSLNVEDKDHARFTKAKVIFQSKIGKEINHAEFFRVLINYWECGEHGKK